MSALRVPSGTRPSFSHSRRAISEPPRRPATLTFTPFAPAFMVRCTACFMAFLKAMRRDSCCAMVHAPPAPPAAAARVGEPASDQLPDGDVLLEEGGVAFPGIPLGVPRPRDAEAVAVRMDLVTHRLVLPGLREDRGGGTVRLCVG